MAILAAEAVNLRQSRGTMLTLPLQKKDQIIGQARQPW